MNPISLSCLLLSLAIPDGASAAPPATTLDDADLTILAEAYHLHQALADQVWQGWAQVDSPIVYIKDDAEFLIGFDKSPAHAQQVEGVSVAGRSVRVRPRTLEPNLSASFDVDGVQAVVTGTPDAIRAAPAVWVLKAAHEMFHVYQYAQGWDEKVKRLQIGPQDNAEWQLNFPYPYRDENVCRLLHLQAYPLYLAVTGAVEEARYNIGVALEAADVLRTRLDEQSGDERASRYQSFQEATEGVARYVERAMAQKAAETYTPSEEFSQFAGADAYAKAWQGTYERQIFLVKHTGRIARSRTEFYNLGMGKCLALDRVAPEWKKRYFETDVWLDDLLRDAIALKDE